MSTLSEHRPLSDWGRYHFRKGEQKGREEGRAKGRAEGKLEGEAEALLTVLNARGIEVPTKAWNRITDCTDTAQLKIWLQRAVTAEPVEDIFDD